MEDDDNESFHSADEGDELEIKDHSKHSSKIHRMSDKQKESDAHALKSNCPTAPPVAKLAEAEGWDAWDVTDEDVMMTPASERPLTNLGETLKLCAEHSRAKGEESTKQKEDSPNQEPKRLEDVFDKLAGNEAEKPTTLWGGWNSWLSVASDSLTNLTSSVGEGLTTVLETMESSIGAPTPEDLARMSITERCELRKKADDVKEPLPSDERDDCDSAEEVMSDGGSDSTTVRSDKDDISSGYQSDNAIRQLGEQQTQSTFAGGLFSNVSHLFESTSRSLVSGSLDVMENIGKKTFHALTEPVDEQSSGRQRRRLKFQHDKPNLSSVLKELKEKSESAAAESEQEAAARRCNYATLFEDDQGMINLEALEMLSEGRCLQMQTLLKLVPAENTDELNEALEELKCSFEIGDEQTKTSEENEATFENFETNLVRRLKLAKLTSYKPSRLLESRRKHLCWIENCLKDQQKGERYDAQLIYETSIRCLAELTASGVEMFHKVGQLLLAENVYPDSRHLADVTRLLMEEIGVFSTKFSTALNTAADDAEDPDAVNPMLTNLFLEASNSSSYIRDASRLLLPVLQVLCIQNQNFIVP